MAFLSYGQPMHSPVVPFIYGVPAPLADCCVISVEGFIPAHSQGFALNLQTGPSVNPRDDVALHMGFTVGSSIDLTLNSIQSSNWGQPAKFSSCPIRKMDPFQMLILVQRRSFMVAFNNQHFCEFHHRIDPSAIRFISVDGVIVVNLLRLEFPGGFQPSPQPIHSGVQPAYPGYNAQSQMPHHSQMPMAGPVGYGQSGYNPAYGQQPVGSGMPSKPSGVMGGLFPAAAAGGALASIGALAAPLFYPGKQHKMSKKGMKQNKLFGMNLPGMGGMMGGGSSGGHYGKSGGASGFVPAVGAGLGAAAVGYGLSRIKHGKKKHGHGHSYGHHGGKSSSSSSSSSSSDSD
ncbi:hypothetical protein BV898_14251 [Hypsibius exemplaris]|uniref:Galectin n=1 Tax=Hypsibius exemplaris TaxID=2072580 RepID=A0A1W0W8C2_HYPEX|nr:hypothetical protein BV898_14251 [Hypsibius exemplaris]